MGDRDTGTDAGDLLSLEQAAQMAGVDSSALRRRIQAGRLQHVRVGRSYATTLRWIAESEEPGQMGRPPKRLPEHLRPGVEKPQAGAGFPKGIGAPALRALTAAGYGNLRQLAGVPASELKRLHGMGPKALSRLQEALAQQGLSLG